MQFMRIRGATSEALAITVSDANGAVPLTGATAVLRGRLRGTATVEEHAALIDDPSGGGLRYAPAASDFDTAGLWELEWRVTLPDATLLVIPPGPPRDFLLVCDAVPAPASP